MKGSRTRSVPRSMMGDRQRLTGSSYLRECLKKQREVAKALFNQDQDLRNIEDLAADIRLGSNLTYENVRMITAVGLWSGRGFWQWPNADEFNDRLEQHPVGDLSTELPEREEHIVDQLLGVFRHIEQVSVVMRFIKPDDYGILSHPVEKILEVSPSPQPRAKYLQYVEDLRLIKRERGFDRVADVDLALWTLQEVMNVSQSDSDWLEQVVPEHKEWRNEFLNDKLLREIRVRNLTRSLFGSLRLADIAEALIPAHGGQGEPDEDQIVLAGRIAGIELERAVKAWAMKCDRKFTQNDRWGLREAVECLPVPSEELNRWHRAVALRNRAVHPFDNHALKLDEAKYLLARMREAIERETARSG